MKCVICGQENRDQARFCGGCGGSLEQEDAEIVPAVPAPATPLPSLPLAGQAALPGRSWGGTVKVALLLTVLTGALLWIGSALGGMTGVVIALGIALLLNLGSYWFSDRLVLMATGAREVTREQAPQLHELTARLVERAGLSMPRLCVVDDVSPNAFATGRDPEHAVVAVTTGLLAIVDRDHLEGILAHELAHVKNRDTLLSAIVAALVSAIMLLGFLIRWGALLFMDERKGAVIIWLVMGLLAPLGATLVQLGISRAREYKADETGALISGKPLALADALERLESTVRVHPLQVHPSTSHLFIVPPVDGGWIGTLFRTHPTTAARTARLRKMMA